MERKYFRYSCRVKYKKNIVKNPPILKTAIIDYNMMFNIYYKEALRSQRSIFKINDDMRSQRLYVNNYFMLIDTIFRIYSLFDKFKHNLSTKFSTKEFYMIYENKDEKIKPYRGRFRIHGKKPLIIHIADAYRHLSTLLTDENDISNVSTYGSWLVNKKINRIPDMRLCKKNRELLFFHEVNGRESTDFINDFLYYVREYQMGLTNVQYSLVFNIVLKLLAQRYDTECLYMHNKNKCRRRADFDFDFVNSFKHNVIICGNKINTKCLNAYYNFDDNDVFHFKETTPKPSRLKKHNKKQLTETEVNLFNLIDKCVEEVGPILNINSDIVNYVMENETYDNNSTVELSKIMFPEKYSNDDFDILYSYDIQSIYTEFIQNYAQRFNIVLL
jgi:hypothetical protein